MSQEERIKAQRLQLAVRQLEAADKLRPVDDVTIAEIARWLGVNAELLQTSWVNIQNARNAPPSSPVQPF